MNRSAAGKLLAVVLLSTIVIGVGAVTVDSMLQPNTQTPTQSSPPENESTATTAGNSGNYSSASSIGPRLEQRIAEAKRQQSSGSAPANTSASSETTIEFSTKANRSTAAAAVIEAHGGTVRGSFNRFILADVPILSVEQIVANDTVRHAELPGKLRPAD